MADPKLVQALKLKAQARLRLSQGAAPPPPAEGYQPAAPTDENTGWFEAMGNTVQNIPGSAMQVGKDVVNAVTHPREMVEGIRALDRGSRHWLESLTGGPETPEMGVAQKFAGDMVEGLKHPVTTTSNDPVGVLINLLGAKGLLGKGLKMADAPTDLPKLVEKAKNLKDATYLDNTGKFPNTDLTGVPKAVKQAASDARFDPRTHGDLTGLQDIMKLDKGGKFTGDLTEVSTLRQLMEKTGTGMAGDSGLLEKTKGAFDAAVTKASPEMATALEAERAANVVYKNTKGLADMLTSGKMRGALRGENATEIKKNITRTLTNSRTKKGYGDIADEMTDIVEKTPNSVGLMRAMLTQTGAAGSAGAMLGGNLFGVPGAIAGGMAGAALPPVSRLIKNAKASRVVEREMITLIRELNGLPPAQRTLRISKLSPAKRAMLISLSATGQDE